MDKNIISQCAQSVMLATEKHAIPLKDGLQFMYWAEGYFYTVGDPVAKAEISRNQIILQARQAALKNRLSILKNLCRQVEHFEKTMKGTERYKPNFTETVARIYELTATCIIKNAIDSEDFNDAFKYLASAKTLIEKLENENQHYYASKELKDSINSKIHQIEKHLR